MNEHQSQCPTCSAHVCDDCGTALTVTVGAIICARCVAEAYEKAQR